MYHLIRNDAGSAIAIAHGDYWVLHLDAGTVRNEENAHRVVDVLNKTEQEILRLRAESLGLPHDAMGNVIVPGRDYVYWYGARRPGYERWYRRVVEWNRRDACWELEEIMIAPELAYLKLDDARAKWPDAPKPL
jgi:hypothetical protein